MESRGKRLVSMILNASKAKDDDVTDDDKRCSSNCSSILSESKEKMIAALERNVFDSDDSVQDPDYNPNPGLIDHDMIYPEDLFGKPSASTVEDNNFMNHLNFFDNDDIDEPIMNVPKEIIENEPSGSDSCEIAISMLSLILKKVFEAKVSRKRWMKADPSNWKRNIAKQRKTDGLTYLTNKKIRQAKIPREIDCDKCFFKCNKISKDKREVLCRHYWSLTYVEKKNFILNNIEVAPPKRILAVRGTKKQRKYQKKCFFYHEGVKTQVCQQFFCFTLAISSAVINDAIANRNDFGIFENNDKRGKKEPSNKTSEVDRDYVKKHIESFPHMEPHYIRKTSKHLYLDASLSITKLYKLYMSKCKDDKIKPVSEITYRRIFCTDYNYSFFVPKKDQCLVCSNYNKSSPEEQLSMKANYEEHIARKNSCNEEKSRDKQRASKENNFLCLTFDLQAVLQIPSGLVGQLNYCRKLCVYNLCMYEAALPNNAYCLTWSEVNGKRGSSEIGTVLYHYLSKCVSTNISEVCFFSDTCGGQNRNQYVSSLLLFAVQRIPHIQIIEHKFLESGHSYMEVDSMHSSIESAKKNQEIYSMPDYISIFKRARTTKKILFDGTTYTRKPYEVKEFKYDEFYDLKKLAEETIFNRSKDVDGNNVKWLKIKRMKYLKSEPTKIFFNYDMSEEFNCIDVSQNQPTNVVMPVTCRPKRLKRNVPTTSKVPTTAAPAEVNLKKLYFKPIPITQAKKNDLMGLCAKKIIPDEYHGWFSDLSTSSNGRDKLPEPSIEEESTDSEE